MTDQQAISLVGALMAGGDRRIEVVRNPSDADPAAAPTWRVRIHTDDFDHAGLRSLLKLATDQGAKFDLSREQGAFFE